MGRVDNLWHLRTWILTTLSRSLGNIHAGDLGCFGVSPIRTITVRVKPKPLTKLLRYGTKQSWHQLVLTSVLVVAEVSNSKSMASHHFAPPGPGFTNIHPIRGQEGRGRSYTNGTVVDHVTRPPVVMTEKSDCHPDPPIVKSL